MISFTVQFVEAYSGPSPCQIASATSWTDTDVVNPEFTVVGHVNRALLTISYHRASFLTESSTKE
jgi:hypothetical protein